MGLPNQTKLLHSVFVGALSRMGPLGRKLSGHYGRGDYAALVHCDMPDTEDGDFPHNYAAYSFLRKYDGFDGLQINTEAAALETWSEAEEACRELNQNGLAHYVRADLIFSVQRKIAAILGEFDPDEFLASVDHSGGASTQRRRSTSAVQNKESDNHCVTLLARRLLVEVQRGLGYYATPSLRNFSRFSTVPKDSKTDRPILIENQGNMFLQKGIGSMIRKRLRKVGVDLNDQRINQLRAGLEGIATIDLSSASDLLWLGLVFLLPPTWADIILTTRTPYVKVGNEIRELHKIGGMGNGFIFELESLIFYCIVSAAIELRDEYGPNRPNHVTVYGDDIIVDSTHAVTAVEALTSFGFRINYNKSYWKGPFRESCGSHYHNGKLITPIYIKHFDFTFGAWYHLYNSLVVLGDRLDIDFGKELRKIEHYLRAAGEWNLIPSSYGLRAGIHCEFDAATPIAVRRPRNNGKPWVQGWRIRVYGNRGVPYVVCQQGAYLRRLREMYYKRNEDDGEGEIIAFCLPRVPVSKRRFAVCVPKSFTPPGGYNNNKGDRRFNLRTCDRDGEGVFEDLEISFW